MAEELDEFQKEDLRQKLAARANARVARLRERHLQDIKNAVKTPEGRRLYWDHLTEAGYFTLSFVPGAPDVTAKHEGMREVGKRMFEDLMAAAPEAFFQMWREKDSEKEQHRSEDEKLIQEAKAHGE